VPKQPKGGGGLNYIPGVEAVSVGFEAFAGAIAPIMGFLGMGQAPDPRSAIGKATYGKAQAKRAAHHADSTAKSGRAQQGGGPVKRVRSLAESWNDDFGMSLGAMKGWSPTGFLDTLARGRSVSYDDRIINTTSARHTGGDAGPGFFLQQFQGSNRGSGNYVAPVPRYSVQETRTSINKYDKVNFVAFTPHSGKKYLEPGTEQMFKKEKHLAGGARKVTRKFL
jgi:hypothetical protein